MMVSNGLSWMDRTSKGNFSSTEPVDACHLA